MYMLSQVYHHLAPIFFIWKLNLYEIYIGSRQAAAVFYKYFLTEQIDMGLQEDISSP